MIAALPMFLVLARTAFNMVADRYIDSNTAVQVINMGFTAAENLTTAELKLIELRDILVEKKRIAAESGQKWVPSQSELDEINARIDRRTAEWDKI